MNSYWSACRDELEKIAISKDRLRIAQTRIGRRPISVENFLKKEKDGSLYKNAYKLQGHTEVAGIPVAIENRKGSVRSGVDKDGHKWRTEMKNPYGYIKGTKGADGEEVDVYVGPEKKPSHAFVVHQHKANGKGFDEDKVMLGFKSKAEAVKAYLKHYDDSKFLGPVSTVPIEKLKGMIADKRVLEKISGSNQAFANDTLRVSSDDDRTGAASPKHHAGDYPDADSSSVSTARPRVENSQSNLSISPVGSALAKIADGIVHKGKNKYPTSNVADSYTNELDAAVNYRVNGSGPDPESRAAYADKSVAS